MYSHSNDASFFVQQTLVATQRDVRGLWRMTHTATRHRQTLQGHTWSSVITA
jgi:hypothetical protein